MSPCTRWSRHPRDLHSFPTRRSSDLDLLLARDVRDVVEVALRVRVLEVDRRRDDALVDRLCADEGLDRPGGAEEVARSEERRAGRECRWRWRWEQSTM